MDRSNADKEEFSKELVLAVSKALYDEAVQRGRTELKTENIPVESVLLALDELRKTEDDRTSAILAFSIVEHLFKILMTSQMDDHSDVKKSDLFEKMGPLSTASARILLANALGWISNELRRDLDFLRKIRNEFAHNIAIKSLKDSKIQGWLSHMRKSELRIWRAMHETGGNYPEYKIREVDSISARDIFSIRCATLIQELCLQISVNPIAKRYRVSPDHVAGKMSDMPKNLSQIVRGTTVFIMRVLTSPEAL
jgi:DNA-binding MltR family transcriptional regulator